MAAVLQNAGDASISEKQRENREDAFRKMCVNLEAYEKERFLPPLIDAIAEKKTAMILTAKSRKELDTIVKPCVPRYYGGEFQGCSPYHVEEEEPTGWSMLSLRFPLNEAGTKRYLELLKKFVDPGNEIVL